MRPHGVRNAHTLAAHARSPERSLVAGVLMQALHDAASCKGNKRDPRSLNRAQAWIDSDVLHAWPHLTFLCCCNILGLVPQDVRRRLRENPERVMGLFKYLPH